VPEPLAREHIRQRDTLADYPDEILRSPLPVYHVTNPPYLYLGYIPKHPETRPYLRYFTGRNEGYQDLYQIALINDLRHAVPKMAYIIPSNFLFGDAISNKIRDDLLDAYTIGKAYLFEQSLFEHTGVHVMIAFFERKPYACREVQAFEAVKVNHASETRRYRLSPKWHYRAGSEFEEFVTLLPRRAPTESALLPAHGRPCSSTRARTRSGWWMQTTFSGKGYRVLEVQRRRRRSTNM
jgi:type I restriction-modification system DNA methylase subunit